ncbi:MAG: threonine/serine dehydratase [Deltaproteobacteria bacterium]|nr:threonine/serine dehydratase [Deltaproteobacteria bacterium]MBK8240989.1 threonine/serine dehydratase [Deltaproteobacteria bacterium]MBK8714003.1 threonine/serine dehydratase [Deltaproteobacteria bacterium]MBP7291176.1 threonine/serine dehydratase [Nannocystaceae bacterium]
MSAPHLDLQREHVREAATRLHGRIVHTPVVRVPALDERSGRSLFFKAENLQRIGAFKARGAMHAAMRIDPARRARGLVTYSSGNHAQAVAWAAREFGVPAAIAMPTDAPPVKLAAVRRLGAEVVLAGTTSTARYEAALAIAERTGGVIVPPFDDPDIIAGQGTATLELLEQCEREHGVQLDALVVPVGGGGLLAGACVVCRGTTTKVWSVEPKGCDAMAASIEAGARVRVEPAATLADGLKPVQVGELNFAIAQRELAGCLRVVDEQLADALVALLVHGKLLVEPSGAAGLAAVLSGALPASCRNVGVILSGGNVEPTLVASLLTRLGTDA